MEKLMQGVQNFTTVSRDILHTVLAVLNTQVLQNVLDIFKQQSSNSYPQYKKTKLFGKQGKRFKFHKIREHDNVRKLREQDCTNLT